MLRRYESKEAKNKRFWEIVVDGGMLGTRHGKVGTDGRASELKTLPPEKIDKEVTRRVKQTLKKGYVLVTRDDAALFEPNPELEQAVLDNPGDDAAYRVYTDWLQTKNDPRGELGAVQARLQQNPDDPALKRTEAKILKSNPQLTPPRFSEMVKKARRSGKAPSGYSDATWRSGFIVAARVARNSDRPPYTVRELTGELLTHPSARLLTDLTIGALGPEDEYDYGAVIEEIVRHRPRLRRLFLADFDHEHCELAWSRLGNLSRLWPVLADLRVLELRAGSMELADITLPRLVSLSVEVASTGVIAQLADASWPALESLALRCGDAPVARDDLQRLLAAAPALRELAVTQTTGTGEVLETALAAPAVKQLQLLDLSFGNLDDSILDWFLQHAPDLASLQRASFAGNHFSEQGVARLGALARQVNVEGQRIVSAGMPQITEIQVQDFAPDSRSVAAARKIASEAHWTRLARDGSTLWGHCQGSELYDVFVETDRFDTGCTCPSPKYPCKHSIALLMLAAKNHPFEQQAVPVDLIDNTRSMRNTSSWE